LYPLSSLCVCEPQQQQQHTHWQYGVGPSSIRTSSARSDNSAQCEKQVQKPIHGRTIDVCDVAVCIRSLLLYVRNHGGYDVRVLLWIQLVLYINSALCTLSYSNAMRCGSLVLLLLLFDHVVDVFGLLLHAAFTHDILLKSISSLA
jgi:hypothetical protein